MNNGETIVLLRRLDAMEDAIRNREPWEEIERCYDQVRSTTERVLGVRHRLTDEQRRAVELQRQAAVDAVLRCEEFHLGRPCKLVEVTHVGMNVTAVLYDASPLRLEPSREMVEQRFAGYVDFGEQLFSVVLKTTWKDV